MVTFRVPPLASLLFFIPNQQVWTKLMRAVVIEEYGSPEVLQLQELSNLEPSRKEVRVKVRAFYSLNRADIEERKGNYPPPIPSQYEIPGLEFAGVVDKLGEGVNNWQLGDRAFGLLVAGGYAKQVLIHDGKVVLTVASEE